MTRHTIILSIFLLFISCSKNNTPVVKEHSHETAYHTCSMHPQIREKKPGKCPICHMNLTQVKMDKQKIQAKNTKSCENLSTATGKTNDVCPTDRTDSKESGRASQIVGEVRLKKSQLKHFSPLFFPVTRMKMTKKIRLLGSVRQSEEKESSIPARIGGRIEKIYVKSTGSLVKNGDAVLDLYSPKLITAGEEYLLAKNSYMKYKTKDFKGMLKQSEEKLKLWGIKNFQFERWYKQNYVSKQITIYSSATGIVRKRNATIGKYFKEGQNFFELSDLSDVWVEMDVYEHDSSLVQIGQHIELEFTALPGEKITGKVDFIDPVIDEKSRTLKVRTTIKNISGQLKPGMTANAVLNIDIKENTLVVPRSSIIDTGKRKVVWTKVNKDKFKAQVIHSGYESEGYVEIKDGLTEGEEVVIEGNFLLDAQAQLFGGYEDMKE